MYDPETMRFNAPDPVRGNVFNPQSMNLYTYVLNSPTNFVDPWGLTPVGLRDAIEGAGGTVSWCATTRTATATVNGNTTTFTDGQGGTHITGNRMQVDGNALNNFLNQSNPPPSSSTSSSTSTSTTTGSTRTNRSSAVNEAERIIQNTFPPEVWDEVADELRHHHPDMSEDEINEIIDRTILMIAANYEEFKQIALNSMNPSAPNPLAGISQQLIVSGGDSGLDETVASISMTVFPAPKIFKTAYQAAKIAAGYIIEAGQWVHRGVQQAGSWLDAQIARGVQHVQSLFGRGAPELSRKINYIFGQATGSQHNIDRSTAMLQQLQRIGIHNTQSGRSHVSDAIVSAYHNVAPVVLDTGRHLREFMVMGPNGGVLMRTIWDGARLITVYVIAGGR